PGHRILRVLQEIRARFGCKRVSHDFTIHAVRAGAGPLAGQRRRDYTTPAPSGTALFEYPDFDPVAISIGPLQIRWYGLMYLAAFIVAWLGMRWFAQRPGSPVKREQTDDLIFYGAIGVIVGGRVGYMLFYALDDLL